MAYGLRRTVGGLSHFKVVPQTGDLAGIVVEDSLSAVTWLSRV
jgi:hypothetical protein